MPLPTTLALNTIAMPKHSGSKKKIGHTRNYPRVPHRPRPAFRKRLRLDPAAFTSDQGLDVRLPEPDCA
jgi:hypothetical protein